MKNFQRLLPFLSINKTNQRTLPPLSISLSLSLSLSRCARKEERILVCGRRERKERIKRWKNEESKGAESFFSPLLGFWFNFFFWLQNFARKKNNFMQIKMREFLEVFFCPTSSWFLSFLYVERESAFSSLYKTPTRAYTLILRTTRNNNTTTTTTRNITINTPWVEFP